MGHEIVRFAARYAETLAAQLDKNEPGRTHAVTCTPVMFLWWTGAHTPCEVSIDGGTPVVWTALTQEHPDEPSGRQYVEFTVGDRTDVRPWPPSVPPVAPSS
ncbi:hypothetical protein N802_12335 [Knoellia sinensis KCTC 19936]|uniref:Uncharacterized protein n=2 Tax=Knoellia TaxID=136099 RepID=A0A0A0JC62_9MICO|nr:hypothetical protein N802_12335 [Knoellia sinensis KCTC 19936]